MSIGIGPKPYPLLLKENMRKKKEQIIATQSTLDPYDSNYLSASSCSAPSRPSSNSDPTYIPGTFLPSTWLK